MSSITERYDSSAARYLRYWAPVLEPSALVLLDRVAGSLHGLEPAKVLDVGTGTGVLARAAVDRWPGARVTGLDGSRAMLEVAAGEASRSLPAEALERLEWRTGLAEGLPFGDRTFELVVSSFVYQLVPDRRAALREAFRVIRPGGRLGYVTWLDTDDDFAPQAIFDDLVDEERLDDDLEDDGDAAAGDGRSGDIPSLAAAATQLRRIGFRDVVAREVTLRHSWTRRSYLEFIERYDASELFESLEPHRRRRVRETLAARFATLPGGAFTWTTPVVVALARKPAS